MATHKQRLNNKKVSTDERGVVPRKPNAAAPSKQRNRQGQETSVHTLAYAPERPGLWGHSDGTDQAARCMESSQATGSINPSALPSADKANSVL